MTLLSDAPSWLGFLFREELEYEAHDLIPKRLDQEKTREVLLALKALLEKHAEEAAAEREERFRALAAELGVKLGDLLMPLRVGITGSRTSPPLLESMALLGPEATLTRVEGAITRLASLGEPGQA